MYGPNVTKCEQNLTKTCEMAQFVKRFARPNKEMEIEISILGVVFSIFDDGKPL